MKQTMIGAFAVDATTVYTANKDHELYRRWVPLMDDEDADDVGVQGYLKISISIVGPGDKMKVQSSYHIILYTICDECIVFSYSNYSTLISHCPSLVFLLLPCYCTVITLLLHCYYPIITLLLPC